MRSRSVLYANGTAALDIAAERERPMLLHVTAFKGGKAEQPAASVRIRAAESVRHGIVRRARSVLESSEMYCSLRYEDYKGVPYHMFTRGGIAALSGAGSLLAILSIVVGA